MGPTGNPTTPKRWFMPCCLRLLAIKVAPSTSLMLFLLLDRADADRCERCRQGPGAKQLRSEITHLWRGRGRGYPLWNSCHPTKLSGSGVEFFLIYRPPPRIYSAHARSAA